MREVAGAACIFMHLDVKMRSFWIGGKERGRDGDDFRSVLGHGILVCALLTSASSFSFVTKPTGGGHLVQRLRQAAQSKFDVNRKPYAEWRKTKER